MMSILSQIHNKDWEALQKKLVQLSRSRAHLHSKLGSGFMEAMSLLGHCALHGQGIRVLR